MIGGLFLTIFLIFTASTYAVPNEGDVLATLVGCCGSGVGVGFDGTHLYWMDFSGAFLHKITTAGAFVADIPIVGGCATVVSWDIGRNAFWGACNREIYLITNTGVATHQFHISETVLGNCGFSCLSLIDGINYDVSTDSVWYSPDVSQTVFRFSPTGTLLSSFFLTGANDMAAECGFTGNSGVAVGAANLMYLGANGCHEIFKYSKTGTKLGSFPIGTGRTEDMECDSLTFASQGVDAIWTKDAFDTELIAFAVPRGTCTFGGGVVNQTPAEFCEQHRGEVPINSGSRYFCNSNSSGFIQCANKGGIMISGAHQCAAGTHCRCGANTACTAPICVHN